MSFGVFLQDSCNMFDSAESNRARNKIFAAKARDCLIHPDSNMLTLFGEKQRNLSTLCVNIHIADD
jgi:hypothetical protein